MCYCSTLRLTVSLVARLRYKRRTRRMRVKRALPAFSQQLSATNHERRPRMNVERSRPEDFLELVERAKRGRLKVYIGPAAGVGKTYQMLEEAHALKKRGVDVVMAFIETHGRAEIEAFVEGLEI